MLKVAREVKPGEEFTYVFDLGDHRRHRCGVEPEKADPEEEYGPLPALPVAILGMGFDLRPVRQALFRRRRRGRRGLLRAVAGSVPAQHELADHGAAEHHER
jgi:hypothetical protein